MQASFPRPLLRRLVLGRSVDVTPAQGLSGLSPLPPTLGSVEGLMVLVDDRHRLPPWDGGLPPMPGEEDPLRLARALNRWWSADDTASHRAVVGVDGDRSAVRWDAAPRPSSAVLLLPDEAFPETHRELPVRLRQAWGGSHVVTGVEEVPEADLVVLVGAEAPGRFSDRLRALAAEPAMQGKLLAAWSLSGALRADLPSDLLAEGTLAGLAIGNSALGETREAVEHLVALRDALERDAAAPRRVERLPGALSLVLLDARPTSAAG